MTNKEIESLRHHFEIDETNLHKEILEQATLYLRWAIKSARSERRLKEIQMQSKVVAAIEMKKIREEIFRRTGKEPPATASIDKTELPLRTAYQEQIKNQLDAEEELDILIAAREAARQRKDMLVQYALMMRDEMRGDIIIKNRNED
jgi:hypothetical protein